MTTQDRRYRVEEQASQMWVIYRRAPGPIEVYMHAAIVFSARRTAEGIVADWIEQELEMWVSEAARYVVAA